MSEIELLFTEILNCSRAELYLDNIELDNQKKNVLDNALLKRSRGEPLQYILGKTEFFGLSIRVNPGVFIPRPETEILVETVIKQMSDLRSQISDINILDIGTGSGCIAISLAKFLSNVSITATDISLKALEMARDNARENNVADKIKFIHSDLFTRYEVRGTKYEIIVSNPPYIATEDINALPIEVQHEPEIALDGGRDGLLFYGKIIKDAPRYLKAEGYLIMEIGFGKSSDIRKMFKNSKRLEIIDMVKDYNNIDRVIVARLKRGNG